MHTRSHTHTHSLSPVAREVRREVTAFLLVVCPVTCELWSIAAIFFVFFFPKNTF